ncbi:hypothetical protein ABIB82_007119 [Bradyrhizobium sp. i1.8.4]
MTMPGPEGHEGKGVVFAFVDTSPREQELEKPVSVMDRR